MRRLDGSLAELTTYAPALTHPDVSGTELGLFAQDRWRLTDRIMFELGFRVDRDDVVERVNYSPRGGVSFSVLPEGRGILRGGVGKFNQRTPLNVGAFTQLETARCPATTLTAACRPRPITYAHVIDGPLKTPESLVETLAWDQRIGRKVFFKAAYLHRAGSTEAIVDPDPQRGVLALSSTGASTYWELETTGRYVASEYRDVTVSYVRAHGTIDLNDYDQFFGNFRNPIIRADENSLSPTDVPNRIIVRGTLGLPGQVGVLAALRVADGFSVLRRGRVPGSVELSSSPCDVTTAGKRRPRGRAAAALLASAASLVALAVLPTARHFVPKLRSNPLAMPAH